MDGRIDRRHDHSSDQFPPAGVIDSRSKEMGCHLDQLGFRPLQFDTDLVSTGRLMHDEEMQFIEFVLLDEEVDDAPDDRVET